MTVRVRRSAAEISDEAEPTVEVPPEVDLIRDVEYGAGGGRPLRMHLLWPLSPTSSPRPAVVWLHGGAWRTGHRDSGIPRLMPLARRGYFCASAEYRFSQEAIFPAQIEDCKCAIRFLRAHAPEFSLDGERIGVWGASSGGHLAAMLGTTRGVIELEGNGGWWDYPSHVNAVCDWFGPTDFLRMHGAGSEMWHDGPDSPESQLIGGPIKEHPERAALANPITYISGNEPPFLIVHGDRDPLVPFNQSELLFDALERSGIEVTLIAIKGAGHGGPAFEAEQVRQKVQEFFDRHLRETTS